MAITKWLDGRAIGYNLMGKLIAKESSPICWQTTIIVNNDYSKGLLLFSTEGALDSEIQSNVSASKEANKAEQF